MRSHNTPQRVARPARGHRRHRNGAIFLLAIYLLALSLVLLSGVALQRTLTEVNASQVSRDLHQAFWIAEAAMDYALGRVQRPAELSTSDGKPTTTPFVVDRMTYVVPTPSGSATFEARTLSARIVSPTQQEAVRSIQATGVLGLHQATFTGTVRETTPLSGIWARRLAIVHGGADFPDTFFTGDVRTGLASFATTVNSGRLVYDGVSKMMAGLWASNDQHADALENYLGQPGVSPEIISLKNGYMFLNQLSERDVKGTTWVWSGSVHEERIPHVAGGVAMGTSIQVEEVRAPAPFDNKAFTDLFCSADLVLPSSTKVIDSGYAEGVLPDGRFGVIDWQPIFGGPGDQIVLCVNSIVPAQGVAWLNTLLDSPPHVCFTKKATIYITGSTTVDLRPMVINSYGTPISVGSITDSMGVQAVWDVSIGAKVSAGKIVGGTFQPAPVEIIMTEPRIGEELGVVWVKPGKLASDSLIYAPRSLVVVRARAPDDRINPNMEFQGIVGKDVVVEMASDAAQFGWRARSTLPLGTSTELLSWTRDDH